MGECDHQWVLFTRSGFRMCSFCAVKERFESVGIAEISSVRKLRGNCELLGHLWESTTAKNFRRCQRITCQEVQCRSSEGVWSPVKASSRGRRGKREGVEKQLSLFDPEQGSGDLRESGWV